jgi:hypothetical protein
VESFFALYADETAAAKAIGQNTAYYILASSGLDAATWITEATAWIAALNTYAAATYGGKAYAQLTYVQRKTVEGTVFANGFGTIKPEYSFWRIMTKNAFRDGTASATYPDVAQARATALKGKSYAALDCAERPQVDAAVWLALTAGQQANVTERVAGIFTLSTEQVNGVTPDNQNIYFYTLAGLSDNLTATDNATLAAANWATSVGPTAPGTSDNTSFYAQLKYNKPQWISMLSYKYFGTDNYSALSPASQAVVDQSDLGTFALSVAQRSPAMPLAQNILYTTLSSSVSATAAAGWAADVGAGMNRELAFYKWMAYEGFRNGIIAAQQYYPTQLAAKVPAGKTYTTLATCEQRSVAAQMWESLGAGEQAYGNSVVAGIWSKAEAEMTDAFAIDQTTAAMALRGAMATAGRTADGKAFYSETAAANFKTDVEGGMLVRSAFYKWLAKESVKESAAAAVLIRESVGEFYIKITNPNEYNIYIDVLRLYFRTTAGASSEVVDAARQVLEGIWVPAKTDDEDGEVILKVLAPTKTYDLLSWLAMAGVNTNTARAMANEVFDKIQNGTIVWTVEAQVQVSHEDEFQSYTYTGLTVA